MVSRTLKNALVGAVVSVVLFFLPFSPALGGAAAGYLGRGDATEGVKVGASLAASLDRERGHGRGTDDGRIAADAPRADDRDGTAR